MNQEQRTGNTDIYEGVNMSYGIAVFRKARDRRAFIGREIKKIALERLLYGLIQRRLRHWDKGTLVELLTSLERKFTAQDIDYEIDQVKRTLSKYNEQLYPVTSYKYRYRTISYDFAKDHIDRDRKRAIKEKHALREFGRSKRSRKINNDSKTKFLYVTYKQNPGVAL